MTKMKPCEYYKIFSSIQPDTVKMSSEVPTTEMDALEEYISKNSDIMEKVYVNDIPFIHFKNGLVYGKDIFVCDMRNNLRSLVESSVVVRQKKYKLPEYLSRAGYSYGTKIPEVPTTEATHNNIDYKTILSSSPEFKEYLKKYSIGGKDPDKVSKEYNGIILIDTNEDVLIGRVLIGNKKDKGFITDLVVDKKYRGLGFGNMLLESAIDKYNAIDLTVNKNNSIAIDLYKKHGFVVDDSIDAGKDMSYMRLKSHGKSVEESYIGEPVTEAKSVKVGKNKYKPMSLKQLQNAADRLIKNKDVNVVRFGETLKESANDGFSDVLKYLSNVNLILFIGGESLATCMPYIVSSILIIKQDNPEMKVIPELKKQRSIIKSKLKPKDDNLRLYTEFLNQVINDELKYTRESVEIPEEFYSLFESDDMDDDDDHDDDIHDDKDDDKDDDKHDDDDDDKDDHDNEDKDHDTDDNDDRDDIHDDDDDRESVTEAKKKDDDDEEETDEPNEDDNEEETTDTDTEEEPTENEDEDEPYNEDFGDEGPTDYTDELEEEPEPEEDEPVEEEKPKPLRKIRYKEDFGKNGPTDYTQEVEDDEEDEPEEEEEEPTDDEPQETENTEDTPPEEDNQEDNEEDNQPEEEPEPEENNEPEEEPQEDEPEEYNEDFGEDGPTDYMDDVGVDDEPAEEPQEPEEPNMDETTDTPEDTTQDTNTDTTQNTEDTGDNTDTQPQEDNNLDNNEETQQDDNGLEDGPTDYDTAAGVDTDTGDTTTGDGTDGGETNEEGGDAGADATANPDGETPTEPNSNDRDIAVKNYNIRVKFKKLVESVEDILQNLGIVIYHNPIQNQVLERGIENIQSIKEQIISYMEFNLSSDYKTNLYYYTTFIQALQLNLDMLTKNSQMSMEDTKNNK